jgi:hypothetical protein
VETAVSLKESRGDVCQGQHHVRTYMDNGQQAIKLQIEQIPNIETISALQQAFTGVVGLPFPKTGCANKHFWIAS